MYENTSASPTAYSARLFKTKEYWECQKGHNISKLFF